MRLTLDDIDPVLADRIRAEEAESGPKFAANPKLTVRNPLEEVIKTRALARRGLRGLTGYAGCLSIIAGVYLIRSAAVTLLSLGLFAGVFSLLFLGFWFTNRSYQRRILRNTENALVTQGLPVAAKKDRVETAYVQLVQQLQGESGTGEPSAREVLRQVNQLLSGYRTLEAQRLENDKAMSNRSPEGLTAELRGLRTRAEAATDETTREALNQSVALCEQRLESVRALSVSQERIAAQQEVVFQTLTSVHTAFAHQRAAPLADVSSQPPVAGLAETVAEVQRRTRSIEQAVEELAVLRRGD